MQHVEKVGAVALCTRFVVAPKAANSSALCAGVSSDIRKIWENMDRLCWATFVDNGTASVFTHTVKCFVRDYAKMYIAVHRLFSIIFCII